MLKLDFNLRKNYKLHKYLYVANSKHFGKRFSDDTTKKSNSDLYDSLGLKSSATQTEIKKAYYDLTFKYHPDRNKDSEEASTKFREVKEAYEILGNFGLRKRYDKGLPLPLSKRKIVPGKTIVEPNVKYQKFFDSRTNQSKSGSRWDDFEMGDRKEESSEASRLRKADESFEKSKGVQALVVVFFLTVLFISQHKW